MTKNKLKNSYTFRAIIAALITAAIIFLPAAALAESEGDAVGGSATSEGFDTGDFEAGGADFTASSDTTPDPGGEPAADLFTPESGANNTAPLPEVPAPETDALPASTTSDQQTDLQEPIPSSNTDTSDENGESVGSAIEASTDSAGSTVDQLG
ncbi:MAG: hypothetical protein U1E11_03285, partial [Dethiobacteria bacterium]|nr:hypothetical protein [Dethiobacteria bacterium]